MVSGRPIVHQTHAEEERRYALATVTARSNFEAPPPLSLLTQIVLSCRCYPLAFATIVEDERSRSKSCYGTQDARAWLDQRSVRLVLLHDVVEGGAHRGEALVRAAEAVHVLLHDG